MAHYLENNSTDIPLGANQVFIGKSIVVETNQITASCSFTTDVNGVLEFLHSYDGINFFNFDDSYSYIQGSHNRQVRLKASYFKIKYTNGVLPQTYFNLYTKILTQVNDDMNVNISADHDSILVRAEEGGLDIRSLTTQLDSVRVPYLESTLTNDSGVSALNCKITSMPAIVIPPITIGDVNIKDSNGNDILSNENGYLQTQIMNSTLTVNTITGYATSSLQTSLNSKIDSLITGTRILASNGNVITTDASNNLNVKVSNFPTTIQVSNFPDGITVNNFPTGITVNNFPSTIEVSNFPTGITVNNFPSTIEISNGITVNNFPSTIEVSNFPTGITVNNFPSTIEISNGITVNNFPSTIEVSNFPTGITVNNFPSTIEISNGITVNNFPSTIQVSNFPTGITVNNFPSTIEISNGITVNNFPSTIQVSNFPTGITVNNFPSSIEISNGITVNNFPSTIEVSNFPDGITHVFIDNIVGITGHVIVDNITNTTIVGEVGTNVFINNTMANAGNVAIHATKGGTVKDLNASSHGALYTEIYDSNKKMKIDNNGSNYSVITDSSGNNINSTNTNGSVYALNTHDYHISQAYNPTNTSINTTFTNTSISSKLQDGSANNITSTTNSTKRGIDCNVINSSAIATTDTNLRFDGSNNLNVNIASGSISVSSVNIKDSSGNNLNAVSASVPQLKTTLYDTSARAIGSTTNNSGASYSLDTHITNTSSNKIPVDIGNSIALSVNVSDFAGNSVTSDSFTFNGATKNGLDVAIINNSANAVPVSTTLSGATSSIKLGDGTNTASFIAPNGSMNTGSRSLQTCASMYALSATAGTMTNCNTVSNTVSGLTTTDLTTFDGQVNNKLTTTNSTLGTINSSTTSIATTNSNMDTKSVQQYNTTNNSGVIGLNINQIYPKYRYYYMRGRSTVADNNMIMGSVNNSRYFYSDAFGISNVKTWWAYSESVARTVTYEYVDINGNEAVGTRALPATTWTQLTLQNGSVGSFLINKLSQNINTSPATNQLYICHTTNSFAYNAFGGYFQDNYNSIFTVPNGYVACVTNVMFYSNAADDYFLMLRWSASGIRDVVYYWTSRSGAQQNIRENYAGQFGGVGVVFTAGETIAFATLNSATYKDFSATVQLMPV